MNVISGWPKLVWAGNCNTRELSYVHRALNTEIRNLKTSVWMTPKYKPASLASQ